MVSDSEEWQKTRPVEGRSANHFDLAFTESDFLLDFGQAYSGSSGTLIHTRIILSPRGAKTLSRMLQNLLEQYEKTISSIAERGA